MRLAVANLLLAGFLAGMLACWAGRDRARDASAGCGALRQEASRLEAERAAASRGVVYLVVDVEGEALALACRGVTLWRCRAACDPSTLGNARSGQRLLAKQDAAAAPAPSDSSRPLVRAEIAFALPRVVPPSVSAPASGSPVATLVFEELRLHLVPPRARPTPASRPVGRRGTLLWSWRPAQRAAPPSGDLEVQLSTAATATLLAALQPGSILLLQPLPDPVR